MAVIFTRVTSRNINVVDAIRAAVGKPPLSRPARLALPRLSHSFLGFVADVAICVVTLALPASFVAQLAAATEEVAVSDDLIKEHGHEAAEKRRLASGQDVKPPPLSSGGHGGRKADAAAVIAARYAVCEFATSPAPKLFADKGGVVTVKQLERNAKKQRNKADQKDTDEKDTFNDDIERLGADDELLQISVDILPSYANKSAHKTEEAIAKQLTLWVGAGVVVACREGGEGEPAGGVISSLGPVVRAQ